MIDYHFWLRLLSLQLITGAYYGLLWLLFDGGIFNSPMKTTLAVGVSVFLGMMTWLQVYPNLELRWKRRNRTKEGGDNHD